MWQALLPAPPALLTGGPVALAVQALPQELMLGLALPLVQGADETPAQAAA